MYSGIKCKFIWRKCRNGNIPAVHINFISRLIPVAGKDELDTDWSVPNIWVFIAQLVQHCSVIAKPWVRIPLKAWIVFFRLNLQLLKLQFQLQWSHLWISSVFSQFKLTSFHAEILLTWNIRLLLFFVFVLLFFFGGGGSVVLPFRVRKNFLRFGLQYIIAW